MTVLSFFINDQALATDQASSAGREICFLVSTSNPPLTAIENTGSNSSGCIHDHLTYQQKRLGIYFIVGNLFSLHSAGLTPNNAYLHFDKSTSLFLLNHFSQSLWGVFLN